MRLRTIVEDISRNDFFDFYTLLYAYQERNSPNHKQIEAELKFIVAYIVKDHLNQLGNMLLNRVPDTEHEESMAVFHQYGLEIDEETSETIGMEKLSVQDKAAILAKILSFNHEHGFTGKTWFGLAKTFIELVRVPADLNSQILVVDKIYNLLHHGGQITDYMDESNWIEDALNYRDNANPAQIFAKASSRVRALIGRASYTGMDSTPVADIPKIYTALRRAANKRSGVNIEHDGNNKITITVQFRDLFSNQNGEKFRMPMPAFGGVIPQRFAERPDLFEMGELHIGQISIEDRGNVLMVTGGGAEVPIPKPVNRQLHLAQDLIWVAKGVGSGYAPTKGSGIANIKDNYYHIDGRRVKM